MRQDLKIRDKNSKLFVTSKLIGLLSGEMFVKMTLAWYKYGSFW